jgi:hypothetical protein
MHLQLNRDKLNSIGEGNVLTEAQEWEDVYAVECDGVGRTVAAVSGAHLLSRQLRQ